MVSTSPPEAFAELPFYSAHFMDPVLWEPFVRRVASRHGYESHRILPGLPGTYPTFIVEIVHQADEPAVGAVVVKFFGQLFGGADSFRIERAMGHFIARHSMCISSPLILAEGQLSQAWRYLIFEHVPGVSIGEVRAEMPGEAMCAVAQEMGRYMRELHMLTASSHPPIPPASAGWKGFRRFLEGQIADCLPNHRRWHDLPSDLLEQITGFIPRVDQLLDLSSEPHLIHADLTADHLLGRLLPAGQAPTHSAGARAGSIPRVVESAPAEDRGWESLAIIDWGDCRVGNILYELVALHVDLFQGDKNLLRLCLEAYGLPIFYQRDFAHKALSMALLHQFKMPARIYAPYQEVRTLDELADGLFGI